MDTWTGAYRNPSRDLATIDGCLAPRPSRRNWLDQYRPSSFSPTRAQKRIEQTLSDGKYRPTSPAFYPASDMPHLLSGTFPRAHSFMSDELARILGISWRGLHQ